MKVIGIVGGVASGKSLVAGQLARLGAVVLDADKVAHEVLCEDPVKARIKTRWGAEVFDEHGEVSRRSLAKRVFAPPPAGPAERNQLEKIVHPRIADRLQRQIAELSCDENRIVVLDAAVMFEAGWDKYCDKIFFIDAPYEQRRARASQRGWDEQTWKAREHSQVSLEVKRDRADAIIDNSGSAEKTFRQVNRIWKDLVGPETSN